jgi:uncharacterized YigZ family protein
MPVFTYRTIETASEGLFKEKSSKFLAFAFPVSDEIEIKEKLVALQKKYYNARHHCYAWVLGADKSRSRAFDDGEPNHSAGDPILGQIRSKDLTDVLVVVVRYFGGVKLGVGGLVTAYKTATEDALNKAVIIEKQVMKSFTLKYPYVSTPEVMRLVKDFDVVIVGQAFVDDCTLQGEVTLAKYDQLLEKIKLLSVTGTEVELE